MQSLLNQVHLKVPAPTYVKDPQSSELGRRILTEGLELLSELGLEGFTFKKLAQRLQTAESSIYRYFENKHQLLVYYSSLYWSWMDYSLVFSTANITDPAERLQAGLKTLSAPHCDGTLEGLFPMHLLVRVVEEETLKVFLTREVDMEDKEGIFLGFRLLSERLSGLITALNPSYPYAKALSTLVLNAINQQRFQLKHFPDMAVPGSTGDISGFFHQLVLGALTTTYLHDQGNHH